MLRESDLTNKMRSELLSEWWGEMVTFRFFKLKIYLILINLLINEIN